MVVNAFVIIKCYKLNHITFLRLLYNVPIYAVLSTDSMGEVRRFFCSLDSNALKGSTWLILGNCPFFTFKQLSTAQIRKPSPSAPANPSVLPIIIQ